MIVHVYEAAVIKPGLARISLSLYDDDMTYQGEFELTVEVLGEDTLEILRERLLTVLNLALNTPKIVYELVGQEFKFIPSDIQTLDEVLPGHKKAEAND